MVFPRRVRWLEGRYANVDGIPFEMPVRTRTSPALFAGFSIDADAAQAILPGQELHACRIWNRGVLVFTVVDYLDTPIGKYVEFCIGLMCSRGRSSPPRLLPLAAIPAFGTGVYIYDLPVSTEISVKGGRGIWGMGKRQANLDFVIGDDTVSSQYDLEGQIAIRIDVPKSPARIPMYFRGVGYGHFRGRMTKSHVYMRGKMGFTVGGGGAGATRLLVGDHRRMDPIRALDINPEPLFTGFAPRIDGVLDDYVETWFLTSDEPRPVPEEAMSDVDALTLSQEWLEPPDRQASDALLRDLTPEQAVGRSARPDLARQPG